MTDIPPQLPGAGEAAPRGPPDDPLFGPMPGFRPRPAPIAATPTDSSPTPTSTGPGVLPEAAASRADDVPEEPAHLVDPAALASGSESAPARPDMATAEGRGEQVGDEAPAAVPLDVAPIHIHPDHATTTDGPDLPVAAANVAATRPGSSGSFLRELPVLVVIAVGLALLIKAFLIQAFYIPSGSMMNTLKIRDRVLVNKVLYHLRDVHRGEIIVFNVKGTGFGNAGGETVPCPKGNIVTSGLRTVQRTLGLSSCGETDFIKRVIAIPGDRIECCDAAGRVVVNGRSLNEPYVFENTALAERAFCGPLGGNGGATMGAACGANPAAIVVPKGSYYVLGDHRSQSSDSRFNGFVPRGKIVGRAFVRVWPLNRLGVLHVPATFGAHPVTALTAAVFLPLVLVRRRRRRRARPTAAPRD